MKRSQIALQLYTLRDFLKTPKEMPATLKKVKDIGYNAVQVSGIGPIAEPDLVKMLADTGLVCCATHEPSDVILANPKSVAERLKKLGVKHTAYPYPGGIDFGSLQSIKSFAEKLNESGRVLREAGCTLAYHNHHIEFRRVEGKTILEWLFELTDPRNLLAELDTHWVQHGGGDPVAWCRRMKGRMPCVHFKDFVITAENKIDFAEVGHGNLDWPGIITACDTAGVQWFIAEQDTCPGDPFVSIRKSLEYLETKCT